MKTKELEQTRNVKQVVSTFPIHKKKSESFFNRNPTHNNRRKGATKLVQKLTLKKSNLLIKNKQHAHLEGFKNLDRNV